MLRRISHLTTSKPSSSPAPVWLSSPRSWRSWCTSSTTTRLGIYDSVQIYKTFILVPPTRTNNCRPKEKERREEKIFIYHLPLKMLNKITWLVKERMHVHFTSVFLTPGVHWADVLLLSRQGVHQEGLRAAHLHRIDHDPCHFDDN